MTGISPEREAAIFARFAEGATTRQVAAEFGIGTGTAARALQRYRDRQDPAQNAPVAEVPDTPAPDLTLRGSPSPGFVLRRQRDVQEELVGSLEGREAASRSAIEQLEAERLQAFDEGRVDVGLRERARNAADEAQDWAQAAELARGKLARIDQQIEALLARDALAAAEAELAKAVGARAAVYARSGDRQRAAIEAVWAAAVDFAAVFSDEQAADGAVAQALSAVTQLCAQLGVPVPAVAPAAPSWLTTEPGAAAGPQLALTKAMYQARRGDVAAVAVQLAEAAGWLPPAPPTEDELAQRREIAAQREKQLAEEIARTKGGPGWQPPPGGLDDYSGRRLDPYVARSLDASYPAQRSGPRYSLDG